MAEATSSSSGIFSRLVATSAFGVLLLFIFSGAVVSTALLQIFDLSSPLFWIAIGAFTLFFLWRS